MIAPASDEQIEMIRNHATFCSDLNLSVVSSHDVLSLLARIEELKQERDGFHEDYRRCFSEAETAWRLRLRTAKPGSELHVYQAANKLRASYKRFLKHHNMTRKNGPDTYTTASVPNWIYYVKKDSVEWVG